MTDLTGTCLFRQHCYVDGTWVDARDRSSMVVADPAGGEGIDSVPRFWIEDTRLAIEAANTAWRRLRVSPQLAAYCQT